MSEAVSGLEDPLSAVAEFPDDDGDGAWAAWCHRAATACLKKVTSTSKNESTSSSPEPETSKAIDIQSTSVALESCYSATCK